MTKKLNELSFKHKFESIRIPLEAEVQPYVDFSIVFLDIRPLYSVVMVLFNAKNILKSSLMGLFQFTTSLWSLDIVVDACTDDTRQVLLQLLSTINPQSFDSCKPKACRKICERKSTNICLSARFLTHIRVIIAETPLWETKAENLAYVANDPALSYISVQADQRVGERGWNVVLSLPHLLWSDVISSSSHCAHNLFFSKNNSSLKHVGNCATSNTSAALLTIPLNASTSVRHFQSTVFPVRETSNRGPLLFSAKKLQVMGFLDERNFLLGNDDHDLHLRAWAKQGWVTGYYPVAWAPVPSDKVKDRSNSGSAKALAAVNITEKILQEFIGNRDGGYMGMSFRGIRPLKSRRNSGPINATKHRDHTRVARVEDIRRAYRDCGKLMRSHLNSLCHC